MYSSCHLNQNEMTDCSFDFHVLHVFCTKHGNQMNNKLLHFGLIDKLMHHSHSKEPVIDLNCICTHLSKFLCFRLKHLQTKTGKKLIHKSRDRLSSFCSTDVRSYECSMYNILTIYTSFTFDWSAVL